MVKRINEELLIIILKRKNLMVIDKVEINQYFLEKKNINLL